MPFVAQQSEKCTACGRTVYATELIIVEDKEVKKPFHKTCLRCKTCNKALQLGNYSSLDGEFWCKPHFKQAFATKGNYDEAFGKDDENKKKWTPTVVTGNLSFIPETEKTGTSAPKEKTETSNATAEKMKKMREDSNAELCPVCSKQVFQAEKLVVEEKNKKKTYHKACFKCSEPDCGIQLDLRTFGTYEDKAYCLVHSKEKNKSNTRRSTYVGTATTFIPEVKEDAKQSKGETPQHIADKFKSFGSQEKCKKCQKSVMATEKLIVEQLKEQHIYHKACLKCSVCDIQLTITSCGSSGGVIYCKTHLKSHGGPKMSNDPGIFVSPLASKNPAFEGQQQRDQQGSSERDEDESPKKQHNEPEQQEEEPERRDESPQKQRDPSPEKERDPSPERQRDPSPQKQRDPSPERQTHVDDEDDEKEKRRIEREKRKKEREDEALKEEEERRQRQEERKKRMQAIKEEEN